VSDLRKDPTREQWVLVRPRPDPSAAGEECPFCPGNEGLTPPEIAAYRKEGSAADRPGWSVRVIPERDPYFRIEREVVRRGVGLYDTISPRGAAELIIESPGHNCTPATLGRAQWEQVLWMYRDRIRDLKRDLALRDILVTRRHLHPGSRIHHPYSRLTAIPIIFDEVRHKLAAARQYYEYKRRCIYCDIVRQELTADERIVRLTEHFLLMVPYAPPSPYGVWILPRQHSCAFEDSLSPERAADLADLLAGYFQVLEEHLGDPPFEMTLYSAPNRRAKVLPEEWQTVGEDYHWHLEVVQNPSRLTRLAGIFVNEVPPEVAAAHLRDAWHHPVIAPETASSP
jgi:UDPglucose--hexose-1-phosphate uridylyltransferase